MTIQATRPDIAALSTAYARIGAEFDGAQTAAQREARVREWDALRRQTITWINLAKLRFQQDLTNAAYVEDHEWLSSALPKLTALDVEMKQRWSGAHRRELEGAFGAHVFATWAAEIASFDPKIEPELVEETQLCARYTALIASASIGLRGGTYNLAALEPFMRGADRTLRHEAQAARFGFYGEHAAELDGIFDSLVHLRDRMARRLGYADFVELGYRRMRRFDYTRADVARYRDDVVEHVVPLAHAVVRERAVRLGLPAAKFWDESVADPSGNPKPAGTLNDIVASGAATFAALHPELGAFYDLMVQNQLLDVENRPGKAGGGFCTNFPSAGVPFIFANFNGTAHDVVVLLHEMGHAYQNYSSRHVALIDNLWPTYETAEIHSMSMEYLAFGEMERFFGSDAERFRNHHIAEALLFIPYAAAVDHFQHLVYEQPDATPAQRHGMWQELERRYLPWRDYGDLAFPAGGAFWQEKRHIYLLPFYYIDYALAQCCALQFWVRSQTDFDGALRDYMALCSKGGTAPFGALVRGAGLHSPFEKGSLAGVAAHARDALGLSATA